MDNVETMLAGREKLRKMICKKCGTYFAAQVACKAHRCFPSSEQEDIGEQELLEEINGGPLRITVSSPDDAIQIVDNMKKWLSSDFETEN